MLLVTITGDETGYQVAVVGSESAHAGELSSWRRRPGRPSGTPACRRRACRPGSWRP
ncbi:MAG: hypothetical protein ACLR5H_05195 [Oscillospiraceae bacterium]